MEITVPTIADGWVRVNKVIAEFGDEVEIPEYGMTLEYDEPIMIRVKHPSMDDPIHPACPYSKQYMEAYAKQLTTVSESDFAYTYGNRLFDYPVAVSDIDFDPTPHLKRSFIGDGDRCGIDQINFIIKQLLTDSNSRRAIAITRVPELDCDSKNPPCLTTVQFKIRNNALHMNCYFRSNDMLMAWYCNAYGLTKLMNYVRDMLISIDNNKFKSLTIGTLTTISECPHIYIDSNKDVLDKFNRMVY